MNRGYNFLWRKIWSNAVLAEPGKRFSRFEAWRYIINVLAMGMDNPETGLKRGEFTASIRQLADCFNWSVSTTHQFLKILLQNSMIMQVEHKAERAAEHISRRNKRKYKKRKDTQMPAGDDSRAVSGCRLKILSAAQSASGARA